VFFDQIDKLGGQNHRLFIDNLQLPRLPPTKDQFS